jgi:class 3 adenylate cyclase
MPLYMDRHYNEDFSPDAVIEAHRRDIEVSHKHGVHFKTYWFDNERHSVFCLVSAPTEDKVRDVHAEAHGDIPGEIIEVDESLVHAFLGRVEDPESVARGEAVADSPFRAIMFTDLKDSTLMATLYGDDKAMDILREHNDITRGALKAHQGHEIKHTGDGFMASFVTVGDAVGCAIEIQKGFAAHNDAEPETEMHLRIGLSAGEPVEHDEQLFGLAVNQAARICAAAEPDSILVAQVVHDLCIGKQIPFDELGDVTPKGFDKPVKLFEVLWREA